MREWIIYNTEEEGVNLISRINTCKGFGAPSTTLTYTEKPDLIKDIDTEVVLGYGIPIFNWIKDCLTQDEIDSIILLDENDYIIVYN